jgi:high-affinity K+ transport system ATPase subunit B
MALRFSSVVLWTETPNEMALIFLLMVFAFVVLLIVAFIFPPTKWAQWLSSKDKNDKT